MANPAPTPTPASPRPQTPPPAAPKAKAEEGTMVTYRPKAGDPANVTWNNHVFEANKPHPIKHAGLLAQAKGNPWFEVEGYDRAVHDASAGALPTDSDGYRRYALAWFHATDWYKSRPSPDALVGPNSKEFTERWASEEGLREKVGVGTDDLEYLNTSYVPRLAELKKAES